MSNLNYYWIAQFKDNKYFGEYDENQKEHSFAEIKERIDDIKFFFLINKQNTYDNFIVDIENGSISVGHYSKLLENITEKKNIRLIFFKRRTVEVAQRDLQTVKEDIYFILGFQYNTITGENRKLLLQIDNNGNFVIGE